VGFGGSGSDLHMYEGRTDLEAGRIIGHENLGEVIECGKAVIRTKVGDRVCVPFNVACGFCKKLRARFNERMPYDESRVSGRWLWLCRHGYYATELAGVSRGESVVIYGAGPVGLMAAYSSILRGASQVMLVDRHPDRLRLAPQAGSSRTH
jgi:glutathione-independent formaldehyde dehydrogenase